jgi:hypothetical protein
MPLTPFPLEQFGGLNVAADPVDIGLSGAVDLLNVDFGRLGALRTRPGATKLNATTPSSTGYLGLFGIGTGSAYAGGTPGVMAVRRTGTNQTAVEVVTSAGTVTTIGPTAGVAGWGIGSFATYGTLGGTTPLVFYSRWGASTGFVLQRMPVTVAAAGRCGVIGEAVVRGELEHAEPARAGRVFRRRRLAERRERLQQHHLLLGPELGVLPLHELGHVPAKRQRGAHRDRVVGRAALRLQEQRDGRLRQRRHAERRHGRVQLPPGQPAGRDPAPAGHVRPGRGGWP